MVRLNVKLINFKVVAFANFTYESFDVAPYAVEFHRVFGVFGLPHKVEAVLAYRMAEMF